MKRKLLDILACPMCKKHPLELIEIKSTHDEIVAGAIYCDTCERYFVIIEEIPVLLPDEFSDKTQANDCIQTKRDSLTDTIIKNEHATTF